MDNWNKKNKREIRRDRSKALSKVTEREKKIETLYDIKQNILTIKKLSENSNASNSEIIKLFKDCDFEFWQYDIDTEFLSEKSKKIINNIDKHLSSMSDEERNEFFKRMGFIIEPETLPDLEKQVTPEEKKLANKIINELDEKLSNMSDEERNEYFKKMGFVIEPKTISEEGKKLANNITNELKEKLNSMTDEEKEAHLRELGFFQDTMPDNIKERAQINKKLVKAKRISKI